MRVLVIGAGVAGLTLAARLEQQGREVVVVERSTSGAAGYAIGLYPLGSCVLHGLGTYDDLLARGLVVDRYDLADRADRLLQAVDMSVLTGRVGPMVMVERAELLAVLERSCSVTEVRRGVTVASLDATTDHVDVELDDGSRARFDVVVACDGIGSTTREHVLGPQRGFDAGWVLWTWWTETGRFDPHLVREWWGRGSFFGVYPVPERVMCAAGGPREVEGAGPRGDAIPDPLRRRLGRLADAVPAVAGALDAGSSAHRWPMVDVRSTRWHAGRVALCGDAAVAFLPTAGVGASNAMRAAAALADELSRADAATVPLALERYEDRCRRVVERNQTDSRRLARVMFVRRSFPGWCRDQLARRYPAERMLAQIVASARQPF